MQYLGFCTADLNANQVHVSAFSCTKPKHCLTCSFLYPLGFQSHQLLQFSDGARGRQMSRLVGGARGLSTDRRHRRRSHVHGGRHEIRQRSGAVQCGKSGCCN